MPFGYGPSPTEVGEGSSANNLFRFIVDIPIN